MLLRSLGPRLRTSVTALWLAALGLCAADLLGTCLVLPLARTSASLFFVLALDALRYFALASLLVLPALLALCFAAERLPRVNPARIVQWLLAILPAVGLARWLASLPERWTLEFPGLLHLYDWCTLGLSVAAALTLFALLEGVRRRWLDDRQRLPAIALAIFLGITPLSLAHLVAAPVYEHRVSAALGVAALGGVSFVVAAWAPPKRTPSPLALVGVLLALLAAWPFVLHPGARFVLHGHTPVAGAFGSYFRNWTDFDGDGSTSTLHGGNDCAPFDPKIAPLRIEIPGDGVDQDCRGGDAKPTARLVIPELAPDCMPQKPQHIVLLTVDALRSDRIRVDRMTFATAFARRSTWYDRAYPPAATTAASLLGIFTEMPISDMNPETLAGESISIGRSFVNDLVRAGYSTAYYNPYEPNQALEQGMETKAMPLDPKARLTKQMRLARLLLSTTLQRLDAAAELGRPAFVALHVPDLHAPHLRSDPAEFDHPYDDLARSLDTTLGEFVTAVRRSPYGDDTAIILSADHGEQLGERGREGHGTVFFEEGVRVPLIVSASSCPAVQHHQPVSLLGIGGLVRRFAQIDAAPRAEEPRAEEPRAEEPRAEEPRAEEPRAEEPRAPVVIEEASISILGLKRAVVGERYKLIDDMQNGGHVAFDLVDDPEETVDRSPSPPEGVTMLRGEYQRWLDTRRPLPSH